MAVKKSQYLVDAIISSKNTEEAISTLKLILKELYLTNTYTDLVHIQDSIKGFQKQFKEISSKYNSSIQDVQKLNEIRTSLNYLYRDIVDELCADVNRMKAFYEEEKTIKRAEGMNELTDNKELVEKYKIKSTSAARDLLGNSEVYKKYIAEQSMAYSNYKTLDSMLTSIRLFTDSIASHTRYLGTIDIQKAQ